jgi:hypothetical protein
MDVSLVTKITSDKRNKPYGKPVFVLEKQLGLEKYGREDCLLKDTIVLLLRYTSNHVYKLSGSADCVAVGGL